MSHDHAAAQQDERSFKNEFMQILHTMTIPMFHEFASDARGNGFPADSGEGLDEQGNPYARVRFILDRRATLDSQPENECTLVFKGLLAEEKIDIHAAYDQRPGKEAAYHETLEIQMINQLGLEDQLTDFLSAAMACRKGEAVPLRKREERAQAAAGQPPAASAASTAATLPAEPQPITIVWKNREKKAG